jgi:2,4-dienoyl-CoA reductase-like NADH-dependent reductase (Old Yellow Enzyme family)
MTNFSINSELKLPCGAILKNRIAKSAMSENMAETNHTSGKKFETLYSRWARGGSGLLITGNIMIDSSAMGEPNNVVIEKGHDEQSLKNWAKASVINGTHLWAQLNHPGKQSPNFLSKTPVAPSAIAFGAPLNKMFNRPKELSETEIKDIIQRFAYAAKAVKDAGFTGVQIHGAHGYLVSQFLSPLHNTRSDSWGGTIENRMRFVCEIYQAMRQIVGADFPIGIKLNSADFQKGGLTQEESMLVVKKLSDLGIDLIEISGGTYERPAMTGANQADSTKKREAYFLDYCVEVKKRIQIPLMLTGGFRTSEGMNTALESGACEIIGLARSLAINPEFSNELLSGKNVTSDVRKLSSGIKILDKIFPLEIIWYTDQLHRIGKGANPQKNASVYRTIFSSVADFGFQMLKKVRA